MYADGIDDDDDRRRDDDDDDRAGAVVGGLELRAPRDAATNPRGPGGSTSRLGLDALAHAKRREKRARESALSFSLDAEDDAGEARARRGVEGESRGQRDGKQFLSLIHI